MAQATPGSSRLRNHPGWRVLLEFRIRKRELTWRGIRGLCRSFPVTSFCGGERSLFFDAVPAKMPAAVSSVLIICGKDWTAVLVFRRVWPHGIFNFSVGALIRR